MSADFTMPTALRWVPSVTTGDTEPVPVVGYCLCGAPVRLTNGHCGRWACWQTGAWGKRWRPHP